MPGRPIPPNGPLPPGVVEQWVDAGGIRFRHLTYEAPGGGPSSSGPPVVLLHGFGARADLWLPFLVRAGRTHRVLAVDLPSHGRSGTLPGKDRSLSSYRRALGAYLTALGAPKVSLVGSSMGGALSVMLALDQPERVARLVLLDASGLTPKLPGKTVRLYLPYVLRSYLVAPSRSTFRSFLRKGEFFDPKFIDEAWLSFLAQEWRDRARRASYLATANAMRWPDASVAADLPRVKAPTLVLWGRNDAHFDCQDNEAAAARIPGSRFVAYDRCGHLPMIERSREATAEVLSFLAAG